MIDRQDIIDLLLALERGEKIQRSGAVVICREPVGAIGHATKILNISDIRKELELGLPIRECNGK